MEEKSMSKRPLVAGLVGGALAAATLVAPVGAEDEITVVVGVTQSWDTLNPVAGILVSEFEVWNIQYAGLTRPSQNDLSPEPDLAESWEIVEDGRVVTYTLRDGLRWSDGEPLTADDVAWTINTARDQE